MGSCHFALVGTLNDAIRAGACERLLVSLVFLFLVCHLRRHDGEAQRTAWETKMKVCCEEDCLSRSNKYDIQLEREFCPG